MADFDVQHDPTVHKFFARVEGREGELKYRQDGGRMEILSTTVPAAIGGRGIAAQLVKTALEFARSNGWRVKPTCSYAAAYIRQHPGYADMVD
jgi:predicted GNAT family acetyltransferase